MVISYLEGGAGSQMFCYVPGRHLAHRLNTEFKLDLTRCYGLDNTTVPYVLDQFNITATIATPEEIEFIKKTGSTINRNVSMKEYLNSPDNVYLDGYWFREDYFSDIRDIILKEFTLKNPLSSTGEKWKEKILSAECAVAMHFRHGDFLYNPNCANLKNKPQFHIPPLDYYYNCLKVLKQQYKNPTVFVFSNNMQWIKDNLNLDVPTEFIEGWQENRFDEMLKLDVEEIYLMSICKHNINPRSAFSWWGAYLNQNPDKKVFVAMSSTTEIVSNYQYSLKINEKSLLDSGRWIYVPFDPKTQPNVTMAPLFSILLLVNNDAATIADTLDSLLAQDYKYYEVIIIDNASTDGSRSICRQKIEGKKNVTFKLLRSKIKNAKAWNLALGMAKGKYVSFIKGNDNFVNNALTKLYFSSWTANTNIIHSFVWFKENDSNKTVLQRDEHFKEEKSQNIISKNVQNDIRLLVNKQINSFLGTKFYNRKFLLENNLKFDKHLDDDEAELFFQINAFFHSKYLLYIGDALYIAPKNN